MPPDTIQIPGSEHLKAPPPQESDIEARIAMFEAEMNKGSRDTIIDFKDSEPPSKNTFIELNASIISPEEQAALDDEAAAKDLRKKIRNSAPRDPNTEITGPTEILSPEDALAALSNRAKTDRTSVEGLDTAEKKWADLVQEHESYDKVRENEEVQKVLAQERMKEADLRAAEKTEEAVETPTVRPPTGGWN